MYPNFWYYVLALILVLGIVIYRWVIQEKNTKYYHWVEQGDANQYRIMYKDKWFAIVKLNGEIHHISQQDYMDGIVEALNHNHT